MNQSGYSYQQQQSLYEATMRTNPQPLQQLEIPPPRRLQCYMGGDDLNGPPTMDMVFWSQLEQPNRAFYLAISPRIGSQVQYMYPDAAGTWRRCWWIKIGDGEFRDSYHTHNPDVRGTTNQRLNFGTCLVVEEDRDEEPDYWDYNDKFFKEFEDEFSLKTHKPEQLTNVKAVKKAKVANPVAFERRNGKAFEWELLKGPTGSESRSEWYRIHAKRPGNNADQKVAKLLKDIFVQFHLYKEEHIKLRFGELLKICKRNPPGPAVPPIDLPLNQAPENAFYFAVSPDPRGSARLEHSRDDGNGNRLQFWWIKLGDGKYRSDYATENPDVVGAENRKMIYDTMIIEDQESNKVMVRRIAKGLELKYLKGPSASTVRYEWYKIWAISPSNDKILKDNLTTLLTNFSGYDEAALDTALGNVLKNCGISPRA